MTKNIKVGDKVVVDTEFCRGFGQSIYMDEGVFVGNTYTVTALVPDEDPDYNEVYGGYIELEGIDEGWYVMEDFKVAGGDSQ